MTIDARFYLVVTCIVVTVYPSAWPFPDRQNRPPMTVPYHSVVQLSGGASSFLAGMRWIKEHGREGVAAVFADTLIEDPDVYRFIREAVPVLGVPFHRIAVGLDPWQVFERERYIGNSRIDPCSRVLKREPLREWMVANAEPGAIVVLGLGHEEPERIARAVERQLPFQARAPLSVRPWLSASVKFEQCRALGVEPPDMYAAGFPHANCGGFCVKAGVSQFVHLLKMYPERYAWHEAQELRLSAMLKGATVLRDRATGAPLSLVELRERVEAGATLDLFDYRAGCGCVA